MVTSKKIGTSTGRKMAPAKKTTTEKAAARKTTPKKSKVTHPYGSASRMR
jgi:hypothetical protein